MTSHINQHIRICARARPLNKVEVDNNANIVVRMKGEVVEVVQCAQGGPHKATFDHAFWSCNTFVPGNKNENAPQEVVYSTIGMPMLQNTFDGYNSCLFAYGQTGSGKTYTVMGNPTDEGIAPRMGQDIFQRVKAAEKENKEVIVEVSFLEIYNEKVRDLLNPDPKGFDGKKLRVREHPKHGTFVEGLSQFVVTNARDLHEMVVVGNRMRTTGATQMNLESSRSHAILTIRLMQTPEPTPSNRHPKTRISRIHFVDLAASDIAHDDKSLLALKTVLGQLQAGSFGKGVSHENSVLTRILRDALGGNCVTTFLALVSPADAAHPETVATLKVVEAAKKIKNKAVINELDGQLEAKDLQREIVEVQQLLASQSSSATASDGKNDAYLSLDGRLTSLRYLADELQLLKGERRARTRQFRDEQSANIYEIEKLLSSPPASSSPSTAAAMKVQKDQGGAATHTVEGRASGSRHWSKKKRMVSSDEGGEGNHDGNKDVVDEDDFDLDDLDDLDMDDDNDNNEKSAQLTNLPSNNSKNAHHPDKTDEDEMDIDLDDLDLDDLDDLDARDERETDAKPHGKKQGGEAMDSVDLDLSLSGKKALKTADVDDDLDLDDLDDLEI